MEINDIWNNLNTETPDKNIIEQFKSLDTNLQLNFFEKYKKSLKLNSEDDEWALIHGTDLLNPKYCYQDIYDYFKNLLQYLAEDDEILDTQIYNCLYSFLEKHIEKNFEKYLIEDLKTIKIKNLWYENLLGLLAKIQSQDEFVIHLMMSEWERDVVKAAWLLFDYPHEKLLLMAEKYLRYFAPFYKYGWSKDRNSLFRTMDWEEVSTAWFEAKFPDQKLSDTDFKFYSNIKNRAVEEHFLSQFPSNWREWAILNLNEEELHEFKQELIDCGVNIFTRPISRNSLCPCGSNKKAKRCCFL